MWQPIETAPKDGTEILGWRKDCGFLLIRYTSMSEFMSESELEHEITAHNLDEDTMFAEDWFYADFMHGGRLEGSEVPTHWTLPQPPQEEE